MVHKTKKIFKELFEWTAILVVASILAYGFFSLLGIVLYLWWFTGVLVFVGVVLLAVWGLLWLLHK